MLFGAQGNEPGLYFFVSTINEKFPFYYIGISTEGKSYNISERVDEHLLEKDYYFYMLAQPNNKLIYHEEALKFYFAHGQKYHKKLDEYERQYNALQQVSTISSIAWITNANFTVDDWENIESFFVTIYKPPANSKKLNELIDHPHLSKYKSKYEEVKNFLINSVIPKAFNH